MEKKKIFIKAVSIVLIAAFINLTIYQEQKEAEAVVPIVAIAVDALVCTLMTAGVMAADEAINKHIARTEIEKMSKMSNAEWEAVAAEGGISYCDPEDIVKHGVKVDPSKVKRAYRLKGVGKAALAGAAIGVVTMAGQYVISYNGETYDVTNYYGGYGHNSIGNICARMVKFGGGVINEGDKVTIYFEIGDIVVCSYSGWLIAKAGYPYLIYSGGNNIKCVFWNSYNGGYAQKVIIDISGYLDELQLDTYDKEILPDGISLDDEGIVTGTTNLIKNNSDEIARLRDILEANQNNDKILYIIENNDGTFDIQKTTQVGDYEVTEPDENEFDDENSYGGILGWLRQIWLKLCEIVSHVKEIPSRIVQAVQNVLITLFVPTVSFTDILTDIKTVAMTKAPFSWFDAFVGSANVTYGDVPLVISWTAGVHTNQDVTVTVPKQENVRDFSTVIITFVALFAAYHEIRRWVG